MADVTCRADAARTQTRTGLRTSGHDAPGDRTAFSLTLSNGLAFHGTDCRQRAAARFLIHEIFKRRFYERIGFEINPGDTIVDVGANMGIYALWAAPYVAHGRIFCIEPSQVIETLTYNLERNDIKCVTPIQCALGSKNGEMELVTYPDFNITNHQAGYTPAAWGQVGINFLLGRRAAKPQTVLIPSRTLESILDEHSLDTVDLLKVDCEGAEYEILESTSAKTLARVRKICVEFHRFHPSHDYHRLADWLRTAGFAIQTERTFVDRWFLKTGFMCGHHV